MELVESIRSNTEDRNAVYMCGAWEDDRSIGKKVDVVAADIAAHRIDTYRHKGISVTGWRDARLTLL